MLNLDAAKRRHVLRMRRLNKIDKLKRGGAYEKPAETPESDAPPKPKRQTATKWIKIVAFLVVYEALFPILLLYRAIRSFSRLDDWLYDSGITPSSFSYDFVVGSWVIWKAIKHGFLYPFYFIYGVVLDCREIQADTTWGQLAKRLFI